MAGFEHYAWLMKSEPSEVSVDDVLGMKDCKVGWFGVRNYQARNFMRDLCKIGPGPFLPLFVCSARHRRYW